MDVIRPTRAPRPARLRSRRAAHRAHPRYAALATAALALGLALPAASQAQLPPNNGGVDQYIAPVPDSGGNHPANPGHGGDPSKLPPSVRASLPGGDEGRLLAQLATDPGSGAPASGGDSGSSDDSGSGGGRGGKDGGSGEDSSGSATTAAKRAAGGEDITAASAITSSISDDPAIAVVLAAILALTLGLAAIGLARRRRDS